MIFYTEKNDFPYLKTNDKNEKQMEQCQFCNNMFGNTQMLRQHQKKTKYCLKIQEAKAKEEVEAKQKKDAEELALKEKQRALTCHFCDNNFKTKYLLNKHKTQAK